MKYEVCIIIIMLTVTILLFALGQASFSSEAGEFTFRGEICVGLMFSILLSSWCLYFGSLLRGFDPEDKLVNSKCNFEAGNDPQKLLILGSLTFELLKFRSRLQIFVGFGTFSVALMLCFFTGPIPLKVLGL